MNTVQVAAIQCQFTRNIEENIDKISSLLETAARQGAQVVCPPELFENVYFCQNEREEYFAQAQELSEHPTILHMQRLAAKLKIAFPVSFFEKSGPHYFNSIAMLDADGNILGVYRKSHIPDGPGYEEKYYFRPGQTGFKVWKTQFGKIGVGICWDQWFPEAARIMALDGADIILYPTAIGSEPQDPGLDTKDPWQRAMIGHAVSNAITVVAANRIGREDQLRFYGHSFIANHRGDKVAAMDNEGEGVITSSINVGDMQTYRAAFGFFRDRRPDLYQPLVNRP
jgi:N-carbamoylputrescine amidase